MSGTRRWPLRGRRRGAPDRRARGLRRQLRAGQPAPHQRPVRLPPLARARAGHRRADPVGRDRQPATSRRRTRRSLFKECSHYCELVSGANQMPRALEIAIREAVGKRGVSVVVIPGDVALQPAVDAPPPKLAGLLPPLPVVTPARRTSIAWRRCSTATAGSPSCAAPAAQGAHDELLALGERLKAPIVHAHARQGARRVGQPLRRRHDRPDRLLVRLLRDAGLRRAADAGDRLPVSAVLSAGRRRRIAQVDLRPENIGRRAAGRPRPGRRRARDAGGAAAAARAEARRHASRQGAAALSPRRARRSTSSPRARRASGDPPAAGRQGDQRPRGGRRHLHLRRRPADGVGGALPGHERQAAAARIVLARLHGQRDGAGDRRAGGLPRPAGDLAVGRRRLHHADGRSAHARAAAACR